MESTRSPERSELRSARQDGTLRRNGTRSKPHIAWEQHDLATNGFYHRYLEAILEAYPQLTVTEERVAALVAGLLPSREIARILGITEHSVENYRSRIRKKIDLPRDVGLTQHLQRIVIHRFTGK